MTKFQNSQLLGSANIVGNVHKKKRRIVTIDNLLCDTEPRQLCSARQNHFSVHGQQTEELISGISFIL